MLVDDCTINRECLAAQLRGQGFEVRCAWDLASMLLQLESSQTNLIVLNIEAADSATLLQVCLDLRPRTRVIISGLSRDRESEIVFCASAGVAGLHLRSESFQHLVTIIREADEGRLQCSTEVSAILLRHIYAAANRSSVASDNNPGAAQSQDGGNHDLLTAREREVLTLLEQGLSNQQIASHLSVTLHTVKNHVHNLLAKLGVGSRAEAAVVARRMRFSGQQTASETNLPETLLDQKRLANDGVAASGASYFGLQKSVRGGL